MRTTRSLLSAVIISISLISGNLFAIPVTLSPSESAAINFSFSTLPDSRVDYLRLNLGTMSFTGESDIRSRSNIYDGSSLLGTYTGSFNAGSTVAQWTTSSSYFSPYLPAINFTSIQDGSINGKIVIENTSSSGDVQFDSNNVMVQVSRAVGPFATSTDPARQPIINSVIEQTTPTLPTCVPPQVLQGSSCVTPPPPTCFLPQVLQGNSCVTPLPPQPPLSPPTTLQLSQISRNAYGDAPTSVDGYNLIATWPDPHSNGFYAYALKKEDPVAGDQIVVAFRGTDSMKNIFTDVAFGPDSVGGGLNALLPDYVTSATQFLRSVAFANQSAAQITLTGHSLGGAIASMIGKYTGLPTETFNAPGTTEAYSRLSNTFAILGDGSQGIPGARGAILNNRVYGDQVSLLGTAQGSVYTYRPQLVPHDHGYNFTVMIDNGGAYPLLPSVDAISTLLLTHSMNNFSDWIMNNSPVVEAGYSGPGLYPFIPGHCRGVLCRTVGLSTQVIGDLLYLLDPPSANGYIVQVDSGPLFSSLSFMRYAQDPRYELFTWGGDSWLFSGEYSGGDVFQFEIGGVDRFRILGYDPINNKTTMLPEDFFVGVTFASSGLFQGSVDIIYPTTNSSVPEPTTLILALTCMCILATLRYRNRAVRVR